LRPDVASIAPGNVVYSIVVRFGTRVHRGLWLSEPRGEWYSNADQEHLRNLFLGHRHAWELGAATIAYDVFPARRLS
jgi:hypothetical protein